MVDTCHHSGSEVKVLDMETMFNDNFRMIVDTESYYATVTVLMSAVLGSLTWIVMEIVKNYGL